MKEVKVGERYKHFKGDEYIILAVGRNSESLEEMVVYQGQYDSEEFGKNPIWIRPLTMFVDTKIVDGVEVPRFSLIK